MMTSFGHEVILYSGERNEAPCAKHHVVVTPNEQQKWFGKFDPRDTSVQPKITWDPNDISWTTMNRRIAKLMHWCDKTDIFCPIMGYDHFPIVQHLPELSVAEWGVGYEGVVTRDRWHWCFESEAWRHYIYGKQNVINGRNYDTVIPNSFDPDDFQFSAKRGNYLLYLGRLVTRKGPHIGALIAERLGMRYVVAGPGGKQIDNGRIRMDDGVTFRGEYVGSVGLKERAELFRDAAVLLVPTIYIEPFGGVACEAMLSGTPVVAHNFGAFTETVRPGVSGYRFSTLPEGCQAVERAMELDRQEVRIYAERFSIWKVRYRYDQWLKSIHGLWADGTGVGDWLGHGAASSQVASTSILE
jgi:glycosyltransferase involved in cell wall biosynthesis